METKKSPLRLLLRAGLMALIIGGVTFAVWRPLQEAEHARFRSLAKLAAHSVRTDLAHEMRSHLLAQVRLAEMCSVEGSLTQKEWESYAEPFVAHHPGYLTLELVDGDGRVRLSFKHAESDAGSDTLSVAELLRQAVRESPRKKDVILTSAFLLPNGNTGHVVLAPIYFHVKPTEFLIAVFDDQKVLADILADQADQGYGISVLEGTQQVYRMSKTNLENTADLQENAELSLPGITWNVRAWPEPSLLRAVQSKLPRVALIACSLIGLLLVATLDFARCGYVKTRELRRTRDDLAIRVQERTREMTALREKFEGEVAALHQTQEELSGRLLRLRDEEQRRIARELHDGTTQLLAALAIDLDRLREVIARGDRLKAQTLLAQSRELTEQATAEIRTISYLWHPPMLKDLGLEGVLPCFLAGFSSRSGIRVDLNLQPLGPLPQEVELAIFRILQEALTNTHRHSGSATAEITVSRDENQVMLQINDRGRGIPADILESKLNRQASLGVGIAGMRERVRQLKGCLDIHSTDRGTSIRVTLPIKTGESRRMKAVAAGAL